MKKALLLFALLFSALTFAQVPQGMSYQAIALNGAGNPVVNSNVGLRLSVLDNSATGTVLYTETHTKTTNAQGLFNLVIGQGNTTFGVFSGLNWKTNAKFLKVEMDAAGGSNYALVGTTQLLTVPYAMAAESLILSPGEGLTLTSPNGTPYTLSVNDAGQLSLPTSSAAGTFPTNLYAYGTFNSFDANSALLMTHTGGGGSVVHYGYKYLTSGSQLKFLSANSASGTVYGEGTPNLVTANGTNFTIASTGFYLINVTNYMTPGSYLFSPSSFAPELFKMGPSSGEINPTYNSTTNTFSFTVTGVVSGNSFYLNMPVAMSSAQFGDDLADGTLEPGGNAVSFPGANATPKNYRVDVVINFNGSVNYTITQL